MSSCLLAEISEAVAGPNQFEPELERELLDGTRNFYSGHRVGEVSLGFPHIVVPE